MIFVTGKGGVGKSIVAAAIAHSLKGKKVLLVETDTYSVFDGESEKSEIIQIKNRGKISSTNLSPQSCLNATLRKFLPSKRVVKAITGNRVTRAFFDSAPSVNEFVLLEQIYEFVGSGDWDHVVVDLPATGHALTFLVVPKTLAKMMRGIGPIGKSANELSKSILDKVTTSIVSVCLPEEMPVNETIELHEALIDTLGRGLDDVILNMVNQSPTESTDTKALRDLSTEGKDDIFSEFISANQIALDWASRDENYIHELKKRLDVPQVVVPMFYEDNDLSLSKRIAAVLSN